MNDEQLLRYSRHILLDDVGIEGQEALRCAHALVVGAGGLGSPAAIYLAASGVGTLTIVDDDHVELTNLQRQILHGTGDIGRRKVDSAKRALARLNAEVDVIAIDARADAATLAPLVDKADVVLDCSDNFATRHAINARCVRASTPLVSGAALQFDGQIACFDRRDPTCPCYACLFPEADDAEERSCSASGVLSPLTGIIGAFQALQAIKLLAGLPIQSGRLMLFDALTCAWRSIAFEKDPACSICGQLPDHPCLATT